MKQRLISLGFVLFAYIVAAIIGVFVFLAMYENQGIYHLLMVTLLADVIATIVIYVFSVLTKNASMYDAYWSVAPLLIYIGWLMLHNNFSVSALVVLFAIAFWSFRLTGNWIYGWKGLNHQDWRYTYYRDKNPKWWPMTNLGGIHLMPTLIVFLGLIPAAFIAQNQSLTLNFAFFMGFAMSSVAVIIQIISDQQMHQFRKDPENKGKCIEKGLWSFSRHPNYFGEISFWWGIFVMQLSLTTIFWTILGPIFMTLLFILISIPLMEKHLIKNRPCYQNYQSRVSMLIPWFQKAKK